MKEHWTPPQPTIEEIRREYGKDLSDEELLLRYLIPGPDVDAMYAAGKPIEPVYPLGGPQGLAWIKEVIDRPAKRTVSASRGDVSIELRS
jgi:oxaloacetate decarboxylase alpha subunit